MSYNFRKKQIEKLKFGTKTNLGMGNSMVIFHYQCFQETECPHKASNANNF